MMRTLWQDIRYALRQLRRSPGFALTAVLTLALGIGANTAIFTLFDQVLLRLLPVEHPRELVRFQWSGLFSGSTSAFGGSQYDYFSYPMYKDLRERNQVFSGMLAAVRTGAGVNWHNQTENEDVEVVSGNYFQVLGLMPSMGRMFNMQDETAKNANAVAVLSHDYWKTRFAASRDVVGQAVLINGHPFTIVGVAPENFQSAIGGYKPVVFLPITMVDAVIPSMAPRDDLNSHQSIWLTLVARLKPGMTIPAAQAGLAPLWHTLRAEEFTLYKSQSERFKKGFVEQSNLSVIDDSRGFSPGRMGLETPLIVLMSMAGLLVAMCVINVATLLLLRAAGRMREISMRYALGAGRSRILSQLLVEGGLLGAVGAALGLAFAPIVSGMLVRLLTNTDPGEEPYSAAIDVHILLFTLAVTLAATLFFSIAPALQFLRPDLANALRQNTGTASRGSQNLRKLAVGVQIVLSIILLAGAGLFARTLNNLRGQHLGFEAEGLITYSLDPTESGYAVNRTAQVVTHVLDSVGHIPGVLSVAGTDDAEIAGNSSHSNFTLQGYRSADDEKMHFETPWITPGYFATLKQPLLAGREFTASDATGRPLVAIVNLALATRYFGSSQNALGRSLGEGGGDGVKTDTMIVGVVDNVKHRDLRHDMGPAVYRPYLQLSHPDGVQMYVRTSQTPESVEGAIRQVIHEIDPLLVVDGMRTMEYQVNSSASDERALAILSIGFAVLALLLAAVGLYGVLAYSTSQRTREIGVRLALGAQRSSVVLLVVREMAWIAGVGTLIALPSAVFLSHLMRSQLYGVTPNDPLTLAGCVLVTAGMVLLASALPAQRAASVNPNTALRTE